jgi:hypothetical protein
MQKSNWLRLVLAFTAVLLVAGPGLVLATAPDPAYPIPDYGVILGVPRSMTAGNTATGITFKVFFTNASPITCDECVSGPAGFTPGTGTGGTYTPMTAGTYQFTASYTANHVTVTGVRGVKVNP